MINRFLTVSVLTVWLLFVIAADATQSDDRTEKRPVSLTIHVPAESAELELEGVKTTGRGLVREFEIPPLPIGREFSYRIRASWRRSGEVRTVERTVIIKARIGRGVVVDLTRPAPLLLPKDEEEVDVTGLVWGGESGLLFGRLNGFIDSPGALWIIAEGGYLYRGTPLDQGRIYRVDEQHFPRDVADGEYSAWLKWDAARTVHADREKSKKPIYEIPPGEFVRIVLPGTPMPPASGTGPTRVWCQVRTLGKPPIAGWVDDVSDGDLVFTKRKTDAVRE